MRSLVVFLLLSVVRPAAAQIIFAAEAGPDIFARGEEAAVGASEEEAFARALGVEVSSSVLYSVFGSTAPEEEMTKYLRRGIYRQELAALLLLSAEKGAPFRKLAGELPGAGGFAELAGRYKADAVALFAAGGRLKAAADGRLPHFTAISTAAASEVPVPVPGDGAAPAISAAAGRDR